MNVELIAAPKSLEVWEYGIEKRLQLLNKRKATLNTQMGLWTKFFIEQKVFPYLDK